MSTDYFKTIKRCQKDPIQYQCQMQHNLHQITNETCESNKMTQKIYFTGCKCQCL